MSLYRKEMPARVENGRAEGEKHPDSANNFETALSRIKRLDFLGTMEVVFTDVDPGTNLIKDPKTISFFWSVNGSRYGNPISFHQPSSKFMEQLDNAINWCYSNGFLSRKNDQRMNPYR